MTTHRKWAMWAFGILGVILLIGWPIAIVVSWDHIVSSHARLGYLIGDMGLVVPLCFATAYGVRRGANWLSPVLLFAAGATAYDAVHFFIYLAQEEFLGLPTAVYVVLIVSSLAALAWFAVREARVLVGEMPTRLVKGASNTPDEASSERTFSQPS